MTTKLTPEEFRARYRAVKEVDQENFRKNWRQLFAMALCDFARNAAVGFVVGSVIGGYTLVQALNFAAAHAK